VPDGAASETEPEILGQEIDPAKDGNDKTVADGAVSETEPENPRSDRVPPKEGPDKLLPGNGTLKTGSTGGLGKSRQTGGKRRRNGTGGGNAVCKPNGPSDNPIPVQAGRKKPDARSPGGTVPRTPRRTAGPAARASACQDPTASGASQKRLEPTAGGNRLLRDGRRPGQVPGTATAKFKAHGRNRLAFPQAGKRPVTRNGVRGHLSAKATAPRLRGKAFRTWVRAREDGLPSFRNLEQKSGIGHLDGYPEDGAGRMPRLRQNDDLLGNQAYVGVLFKELH
jgi:hypothetical protein